MQEAENLREIRIYLEKSGFAPDQVVVPRPLLGASTRRMLVIELLSEPKLIDGVHNYYSEWAIANGTTLEETEAEAHAKIETEGIPAKYDSLPGWQISLRSLLEHHVDKKMRRKLQSNDLLPKGIGCTMLGGDGAGRTWLKKVLGQCRNDHLLPDSNK